MIKKSILCSILVCTAVLLFAHPISLEARSHCRGPHIQIGFGGTFGSRPEPTYVVRRYVRPVRPAVYVVQEPYCAPVYAYPAPQVAYLEEVYVPKAPRPLSFAGLSFSWN